MPGTQIKVFDKIVQVIELLATSSQGVTLKKAQQALGLNKGTAFRILRTLESHDVAARNGDGAFVLGNRVLWWETCYRQNLDLSKLVRPHLEKLRDLTAETAAFSILMGNQTVVVDQAISPHATSTRFDIGFSAPLYAGATGRIILAHLDPERRKNLFSQQRLERLTERTITDRKRLERELNKCLALGFAFSEGERLLNTSSVAAPIFGTNKEVLGAISVTGPSDRLTHSRCKSIASILLRETRLLTERLRRADPVLEKQAVGGLQA
ncbi:MAG: IclR family transcriptional regulator [Deltaproteobacteria bacterium]|nr:IclR family transcriptional regulator [Deltaproteobacteria bacterium]